MRYDDNVRANLMPVLAACKLLQEMSGKGSTR